MGDNYDCWMIAILKCIPGGGGASGVGGFVVVVVGVDYWWWWWKSVGSGKCW